jgi:hypothetical protein
MHASSEQDARLPELEVSGADTTAHNILGFNDVTIGVWYWYQRSLPFIMLKQLAHLSPHQAY